MKKTILTLSLVALFSIVSKAQQATTTQPGATGGKVTSSTVVNSDGTVSTVTTTSPPTETTTPVKKSGTRMAINEKGLPGGTSPKKDAPKEEKSTIQAQPGASTKKN